MLSAKFRQTLKKVTAIIHYANLLPNLPIILQTKLLPIKKHKLYNNVK